MRYLRGPRHRTNTILLLDLVLKFWHPILANTKCQTFLHIIMSNVSDCHGDFNILLYLTWLLLMINISTTISFQCLK